jgi:hypothetical protein
MQDDRLPLSLTAIKMRLTGGTLGRHSSAQARADPVKEAPDLQWQRICWSVKNIYWQRFRCELRQQFLQSARVQMFVDLVRKHANNADTS